MTDRKVLFGVFIALGILSNQPVTASQAPVRPQAMPPQAGVSHPGTAQAGTAHPGAVQATPGAHSGKKEPSGEKEVTPVKKELIELLKSHKDSSPHCTAEGKNHTVTAAVIEEKATKVKKKQGSYIITLSSGTQVTCSKAASK